MNYEDYLDRIHEVLLILLDELYRVCRILNIDFYMLGGTLLGAVRHNGFIPWDDDVDVGMLRKDFDILFENRELLSENVYLESFFSEKENKVPWLKLRLKNTVFLEKQNVGFDLPSEFFVDIIPIDKAPDSKLSQRLQMEHLRVIEALLFSRINKEMDLKHRIIKCFSRILPISNNKLKAKYVKVSCKYNDKPTNHIRISSISHRYFNDVFPRKIILSKKTYCFEKRELVSFGDYDYYLSQLYGDYMTLPP